MRALLALVLGTSAACGFSGSNGSADGPDPDDPCTLGFVNLCGIAAGTQPLVVAASTKINTDTDARCKVVAQSGGPDICVLSFSSLEISSGATLTFYGSRAVAVAATTEIIIAGTLDVASRRNTQQAEPGAGSLASCMFERAVKEDLGGGSGGAGGTYATQGGAGGDGDLDNDNLPVDGAAPGGMPGPVDARSILRGGCSGQTGGYNNLDTPRGRGGRGGGAIFLTAPLIQVQGRVSAAGAGGSGGSADLEGGGGGGGGSGGAIIFQGDKVTIEASAVLLATGGGGGQGGTNTGIGEDGGDATDISAAPGGDSMPNGGDGGAGATSAGGAAGIADNSGGGGGGGGTGYIRILSPMAVTTDAAIEPPAVITAR
jgi:hypothetical protein